MYSEGKTAVITGSIRGFGFTMMGCSKDVIRRTVNLLQPRGGESGSDLDVRKEFAEVQLFKPWTPMCGLLCFGWENLTETGQTPVFELKYQEAYPLRFSLKGKNE